jgi:hypothetical protein
MHNAFGFRLSPEADSDENLIEKWPILNLILAAVLQTSVEYSSETKPRLTGQNIMKLVRSGLPDSVVLSAINLTTMDLDGGKHDSDSDLNLQAMLIIKHFLQNKDEV